MPTKNLSRYGNFYDGGYVVSRNALSSTSGLTSFGLGRDFSFEKSIYENYGIPATVYDHSVRKPSKVMVIIFSLLKLIRKKSTRFQEYKSWLHGYNDFFVNSNLHVKKKVVLKRYKMHEIGISEIFGRTHDLSSTYLKLDIEGNEYAIFEYLLDICRSFTGICIEFHEVELNFIFFKKIIETIRKSHNLIFINANNYSNINNLDIPDVLEISFVRKDLDSDFTVLSQEQIDNLQGGGNTIRKPKYEFLWD
jgi:hypothetical protein